MSNTNIEPNRLLKEVSPYLLQHAYNPVDWLPWGEEAFERAKEEDKPIFLSIGYSTCHWCHVMAHESFENEEIANILNANFISIKVDREERPDIDSVYMAVCQALTGSGGWPTSIFLTWEQKPFYAGTYFPPRSRYGMIGLKELLMLVTDKWKHGRTELQDSAEKIVAGLRIDDVSAGKIDLTLPDKAVKIFEKIFDEKNGGFGSKPKFPSPHNLLMLIFYSQVRKDPYALKMAEMTLVQMRKGGIFDHIGYGFSRYSTDEIFLAPHFEKMLYDNALLLMAYVTAYSVTGERLHLDTAEKIVTYVLREMTDPKGGFYSAQDADSDGVEGKYYLFGYDEILEVLGKDLGNKFNDFYGISQRGNFEGLNIPNRLHSNEFNVFCGDAITTLYEYRKKREKLHLDDKILTSWNGLMILSLTLMYRVTKKPLYLESAQKAQLFIEENLAVGDKLLGCYRDHKNSGNGFLDDYAFYIAALIGLYEATGYESYLESAVRICKETINQFEDCDKGGFYLSGKENERLIIDSKETYDGAMPSGNSVMAYVLVRLSQLTQDIQWIGAADKQLAFLSHQSTKYPSGHSMFLFALLLYENPPPKITVVLARDDKVEDVKKNLPLYSDVTLVQTPTEEYNLLNGQTTYYVCKGHTCLPPTNKL